MGLNVTISDDLARFVAAKVESGAYPSAEAVVEDALRRLAEAQASDAEKLAWLRAAWDEGVASGEPQPIDFDELKREARRRRAERL